MDVSISTASRHVVLLRRHRLLEPRRQGVSVYYRLTDHPFHKALRGFLFDAASDESRG